MNCPECNSAVMATVNENHLYAECGLPNVTLKGVLVRRCPNCGAHLVSIPKLSQLHRAIALTLINKPERLTPAEIRFLRKSLGWSGADFARKLHTRPEQVSRWESEASAATMSISNELLLRLLVAHGQRIDAYSENLEKVASLKDAVPAVLSLQRQDGDWYQAA